MHGTAVQWADDGTVIGTYEMRRGTGLDVWRCRSADGRVRVTEIHGMRDGKKHGFTWWIEDRTHPNHEEHFWEGHLHGIERMWNENDRLCRGYPRYWIRDEQVRKRKYLRASAQDESLPEYRVADQLPTRRFPMGIRAILSTTPVRRRRSAGP